MVPTRYWFHNSTVITKKKEWSKGPLQISSLQKPFFQSLHSKLPLLTVQSILYIWKMKRHKNSCLAQKKKREEMTENRKQFLHSCTIPELNLKIWLIPRQLFKKYEYISMITYLSWTSTWFHRLVKLVKLPKFHHNKSSLDCSFVCLFAKSR